MEIITDTIADNLAPALITAVIQFATGKRVSWIAKRVSICRTPSRSTRSGTDSDHRPARKDLERSPLLILERFSATGVEYTATGGVLPTCEEYWQNPHLI